MLKQLTSFYYFYETEVANVKTKDIDTDSVSIIEID
jgi:hypothetical protein